MPVVVRWRGDLYRLVDVETATLARDAQGNTIDKGGGASEKHKTDLEQQAKAINANLAKRRETAANLERRMRERERCKPANPRQR